MNQDDVNAKVTEVGEYTASHLGYKLEQFEMLVPADITRRFAGWWQDVASQPGIVPNKPVRCTLCKLDGTAYPDSTVHAQMYRATHSAELCKEYPLLKRAIVRKVHKRAYIALSSK